jgi:hypothetical protein
MLRVRATIASVALLWSCAAHAQSSENVEPEPDSVLRHFEAGRPRPFVAGRLDLGLNARSMVALGWGRPHWLWVGAVGISNFTPSNASQAGGFQLGAPFGELTLQARRVAAYRHRFLSPIRSVVRDDLTAGDLPTARYGMLEASLTAFIPARVGFVYVSVWVDRLLAVSADTFVYDEISRSVVRGPWVGVEQLGFLFFLTNDKHHRLGPLSEHLWSDRSSADVVRLGVAYSAQLTSHLALLAYVTEPIHSPDSLGAWWAAGGTLSLRYAWASQDL